jgi:hypothetical protein
MRPAIAVAALAIAVSTADAHCYSRWYYPWPQHCGVKVVRAAAPAAPAPMPPVKALDGMIPLPDLVFTPGDEPDADTLIRMRLIAYGRNQE